jgi:hypothetical protein
MNIFDYLITVMTSLTVVVSMMVLEQVFLAMDVVIIQAIIMNPVKKISKLLTILM